jgi:hypothetical protein
MSLLSTTTNSINGALAAVDTSFRVLNKTLGLVENELDVLQEAQNVRLTEIRGELAAKKAAFNLE